MNSKLADLAFSYNQTQGDRMQSRERLQQVFHRYAHASESSVLEAAAATGAIDALFLEDQVDLQAVTPQMQEAFELANPGHHIDELANITPQAAQGWLNNWKGKYFEVVVRDELNSGAAVGQLQLEPDQVAVIPLDPSQPGWDLQILNGDGTVAEEIQLKATKSVGYVKEALDKYPNITILTTEEAADPFNEMIVNSEIQNSSLDAAIRAPMEELLDGPLEELSETILPGLPFVLIATTQGAKVLMGRQTFQIAANKALDRSAKTGAAIGVGALVALAGAGILSLPATFLTRLGVDRIRAFRLLQSKLEWDSILIRALARPHPSLRDTKAVRSRNMQEL